jgi:lysyl-tRNA synthetase class 2
MMESYESYADYTDVMRMVEEMVSGTAEEVLGSTTIEFDGRKIDLTPPWPRLDLREQVRKHSDIDFLEHMDIDSLRAAMEAVGVDVTQQVSWGGMMDKLISSKVEPNLQQPSFLVDYPVEMSPLAKRKRDDLRLVERFEGFVAGM